MEPETTALVLFFLFLKKRLALMCVPGLQAWVLMLVHDRALSPDSDTH